MKKLEEIKEILAKHKDELRKKFKVKSVRLFGSYVRGDYTEDSDLDILVEFEAPVGFEFIHLADYLEEILGVKIDLLTQEAIKPNRWKYIKEELVYV